MYSIVYIVVVVFLAFVKANNTNIFTFLNKITNFNDRHIVASIIVPIIQFAYQVISSIMLSILSYNMKFAKIMDIVYDNLTESQRSWFSILLYSFEIVVYLFVISAYSVLFASGLGVVSNIKNKNQETNINNKVYISVALISLTFIVLHGWISNRLDREYNHKPRELVKHTINIFNLTMFVSISVITMVYVMRQHQIPLPLDDDRVSKAKDFLKPVAQKARTHVMLTIVLQTVFYVFHVIKSGTSDQSINHSIKKEQIFASIVYVLSTVL